MRNFAGWATEESKERIVCERGSFVGDVLLHEWIDVRGGCVSCSLMIFL
jgi:hypothetical protein